MTTVLSRLIEDLHITKQRLASAEVVLNEYITWKKDEPKFRKHFEKLVENRAGNSIRDYEQQEVSKP